MKTGESRRFSFEIHILPFKPIDYKKHFAIRYSHSNKLKNELKEVDNAKKLGLNNIIIHHGNMIHPFINYPFIEVERLKNLVEYSSARSIGVKVYYTIREHSNHMAEVWAYKALGDEIIFRKKGQGYNWHGGVSPWLTKYFGDEIIPAWQVLYKSGKYKGDHDVSFICRPNSRLDNYYIEGLDYLVKNVGIKGIYIDDTALDRTTIERARKVLDQVDGLIDMHMWNHEEERAGDVSCMSLYTEIFPFLDSLWIGEGYDYTNSSKEFIMTEISGLPYGLTSQMLQGGGNPYVGMLYAMNNRYGWGQFDAPTIYRLWDIYKIQDSKIFGYWNAENPITTHDPQTPVTTYLKDDSALLAIFNFDKSAKNLVLDINFDRLGFENFDISIIKLKALKSAKTTSLPLSKPINSNNVTLGSKKGLLLLITKK